AVKVGQRLSVITVTFDRQIRRGLGTIAVTQEGHVVPLGSITVEENVLQVALKDRLVSGALYRVILETGAGISSEGGTYSAAYSWIFIANGPAITLGATGLVGKTGTGSLTVTSLPGFLDALTD